MNCLYLLLLCTLKYGINYGQEPEDNTDVILIGSGAKNKPLVLESVVILVILVVRP